MAARGAITRRPRVVRLVRQTDGDARAVSVMQHLRDSYGPGPLQVRVPGRRLTLVLDPGPVRRPFNEQVLQTGRTLHEISDPAATVVSEETAVLLDQLRYDSDLDWPRFSATW